MGKVHGSLARAGKVKGQMPKVEKQEKKKKKTGRAKKRDQYTRRFVNAVVGFGGKRKRGREMPKRGREIPDSTNDIKDSSIEETKEESILLNKESLNVQEKTTIALDLEWYDQSNGDHLTEIGISIISDTIITNYHYIIKEHKHFINKYAPTSKLGFLYGESQVISITSVSKLLNDLLFKCNLVFHGGTQDKITLLKNGIDIVKLECTVFDTAKMFDLYLKINGIPGAAKKKCSLENCCKLLLKEGEYRVEGFHNGGNDAAYTLKCFKVMMIDQATLSQ